MKSIERRFETIIKKYPYHSSFVCFGRAIKSEHFSRDMIKRWFNKLVDKDDYDPRDKRKLFDHFELLSKGPEDDLFSPLISPQKQLFRPSKDNCHEN
jgi:hypothetical protein